VPELVEPSRSKVEDAGTGTGDQVHPDAEALLLLFAEKVRDHGEVVEVLSRPDHGAVVLDLPSDDLQEPPTRVSLHLDESVLLEALATSGDDGMEVWGEALPVSEALARLMSVHLDESLATRGPSPNGWWTYDGGMFEPRAPWDQPRSSRVS
jgi:hypothetical protein